MITKAYTALYLGRTPSHRTGTSSPSCLLLENRLYICDLAQAKMKYFFCGDLFNFLLVLDYHLGEGFSLMSSSIFALTLLEMLRHVKNSSIS